MPQRKCLPTSALISVLLQTQSLQSHHKHTHTHSQTTSHNGEPFNTRVLSHICFFLGHLDLADPFPCLQLKLHGKSKTTMTALYVSFLNVFVTATGYTRDTRVNPRERLSTGASPVTGAQLPLSF